jgi:hypothetical protein
MFSTRRHFLLFTLPFMVHDIFSNVNNSVPLFHLKSSEVPVTARCTTKDHKSSESADCQSNLVFISHICLLSAANVIKTKRKQT